MANMRNADIVLGEGITEKYYIKSLLDVLTIRPRCERVKPYNTKELEAAIIQYAKEGYTTIHCLIDMDKKVNEPKTMENYKVKTNSAFGNCVYQNEEVVFESEFPIVIE